MYYHPIFWLLGMSGSGKTTLSSFLLRKFPDFVLLDGDSLRKALPLPFSKSGIELSCHLILEDALKASQSHPVIVNKITPYQEIRDYNREIAGEAYHEIYCKCSLSSLMKRDVKGLYRKAILGGMTDLVGVSKGYPFEDVLRPDLVLNTEMPLFITKIILSSYIRRHKDARYG